MIDVEQEIDAIEVANSTLPVLQARTEHYKHFNH